MRHLTSFTSPVSGHGPFSHMFDGMFIPKARPAITWKVIINNHIQSPLACCFPFSKSIKLLLAYPVLWFFIILAQTHISNNLLYHSNHSTTLLKNSDYGKSGWQIMSTVWKKQAVFGTPILNWNRPGAVSQSSSENVVETWSRLL